MTYPYFYKGRGGYGQGWIDDKGNTISNSDKPIVRGHELVTMFKEV